MSKVPHQDRKGPLWGLHDRFLLADVCIPSRPRMMFEEGVPLLSGDRQRSQGCLALHLNQLGLRALTLCPIHVMLEESRPKGITFHIEDGTGPVPVGAGGMEYSEWDGAGEGEGSGPTLPPLTCQWGFVKSSSHPPTKISVILQ